jgi:hypothetical protein
MWTGSIAGEDYAGAASAENLQFSLGQDLGRRSESAREVFLRLLEFVRCLDQSDAQVIERIAPMVLVRSFIFNEKQGAPTTRLVRRYPSSRGDRHRSCCRWATIR